MNRVIKEVISHGIDPALAYRFATLVGARNYALKDHGAIAPGYLADIVLLTDPEKVVVSDVFVNGKQVSQNGKLTISIPEPKVSINSTNSVRLNSPLKLEMFTLTAPIKEGEVDVNTIVYEPSRLTHLEVFAIPVVDHHLQLDALNTDLCFVTVIPRHGQKHPAPTVVLKGLEWRRGTMAMTIAHDSHNLIVAGHDPSDMLLAAQELEKCGGGVAFVDQGKVLGKVALPLAGLMSSKSVAELAEEIEVLDNIALGLGVEAPSPALAIVGLALVVAPRIRVSDLEGLFDTLTQTAVPIFPNTEK